VVWRAFFGNQPIFSIPFYTLVHPVELLFYVALGVAAALVAVGFVKVLYWLEDRFDAMKVLEDAKPALGAIAVGLVGTWSVLVLGSGVEGINAALTGALATSTMLLLLGAKLLATSFTLGSGGSGGVFSPSLFLGAMLGAVMGRFLHSTFPAFTAPQGAYALVGMGAVFAAAAQAPMTSILIIFEMTNDYRILVPLMLAVVTATIVYQLITPNSIYLEKLRHRGVTLGEGRELHLLETIPISVAVDREPVVLKLPSSVEEAAKLLERTKTDVILVTPTGRKLGGALYPDDLHAALEEGEEGELGDLDGLIMQDVPTVHPRDSLDEALRKLTLRDLYAIPVIDGDERIVGIVSRDRIMRAYRNALAEKERGSAPS
jgi:CIC family chloride channel protein